VREHGEHHGPAGGTFALIERQQGTQECFHASAIKPDTEPGLEKWLRLNAEFAKFWPNITTKKPPPPDSKDWEGKPDKFQFFSPNPGAGD
jgi:hypothetical protein